MRKIIFSKRFMKIISGLQRKEQEFVYEELDKLERGDRNIDIKKISGKENLYRIRKGDYRIFFSIENNNIYIIKLEHRKEAYR
jgi:mRNA interferase RelE/StbE